jgi:hypothetical protein
MMTALLTGQTYVQTAALTVYVGVIVAMAATVLIVSAVDRRKRGNKAYRDRVDAIIDEALPREDAPAKWRANREEQRQ